MVGSVAPGSWIGMIASRSVRGPDTRATGEAGWTPAFRNATCTSAPRRAAVRESWAWAGTALAATSATARVRARRIHPSYGRTCKGM